MTTKSKGITLPAPYSFTNITGAYLSVTDTALDYTSKNAWNYGAGFLAPFNPTVLTAVAPANYSISGQNAAASFASIGGNVSISPGVGSAGDSSGNLVLKDTSGAGGTWAASHYVMGSYHLWFDANNTLRWKTSIPTADQDGLPVGFALVSAATYDAPSLADGVGTTTTVACAGAVLGDFAFVSFSIDTVGVLVTSWVSAANVVSIRLQNETGGTVDLASCTIRVKIVKG